MDELGCRKSTFSGGPEGECLSDTPDVILATAQETLSALVQQLKARP
ncbi:DUF397 domain-containing protein [Streptomyces sp. NPDC060000]